MVENAAQLFTVHPLKALNSPPSSKHSTTAVPWYPLAHATAPKPFTVVAVTASTE